MPIASLRGRFRSEMPQGRLILARGDGWLNRYRETAAPASVIAFMIEALVPEIEEIGGYSWDTAPLAWRLRVTARCQRQEVRKDLGTLLQLTLLAPDVVDGIPDGRQLASVALPAVAGAVRGAMVGSTCSIGGLQNLRRQRPQLTTLGGMRTFEKLRALCAARSSLQLGHEALHETGSRFELLDSNELIRLVGLGDVP